jgi:hypothetical protein
LGGADGKVALVEPGAKKLDVGIMLKGVPVGGRLEQYPSTMCTHRVRIAAESDIDRDLIAWLRQAYDAA